MSKQLTLNAKQGDRLAPRTKSSNKKKKNRQRKRRGQMVVPRNILSACAQDYFHAMADPFGFLTTGRSVCIPDLLDMPSFKFSVLARGAFTIGTVGVGFVGVSPFCWGNDVNAITQSISTAFTGNSFQTAGPGVQLSPVAQNPYAVTDPRRFRTVAAGLRVRYIGTELNRGGRIIPCAMLGNSDSLFGLKEYDILNRPDVKSIEVDRKWHGCVFRPLTPEAYTYTSVSFPLASGSGNNLKMGVLVTGSATANVFEWEYLQFNEAISANGTPIIGQTASHSDIVGISRVRDYLGQISSSEIGQQVYQKGMDYIKSAAATAVMSYVGVPSSSLQLEYL